MIISKYLDISSKILCNLSFLLKNRSYYPLLLECFIGGVEDQPGVEIVTLEFHIKAAY
jgi:hypothetical protein